MKFANHKYTWSKPFSSVRHEWSLCGPIAAVHFHVSVSAEHGDTAGLEIHYFEAPEYMADRAPSHIDCAYTGGRCWHDGTSLYAMETLWPMIEPMLRSGDHEIIFHLLEDELSRRMDRLISERAERTAGR
jgi:hypothetical protein